MHMHSKGFGMWLGMYLIDCSNSEHFIDCSISGVQGIRYVVGYVLDILWVLVCGLGT